MMEFSTIFIPALLLASPILSLFLFFIPKAKEPARFEKKMAISLFVFNFLVSLFGVLRFQSEVKMGFIIPFSLDGSGYFDFSLSLFWSGFIWIMTTSVCLMALSIYDGDRQFLGENKKLRFYFLAGISLFSSLAALSENIILSILFLEVMFFLFHADGLLSGGDEARQERDAFFRRAAFIMLGLLITLVLNALDIFETKGIILLGGLLYATALIFSRHNFSEWSSLSVCTAKMSAALFLLNKIMKSDLAPESWVFIAGVFALISVSFSLFSLLTNRSKDSAFWLLFSCFSYLLFLRFYSGFPQAGFWSAYEAIGLLSAFSLALIVRYSASLKGLSSRAGSIFTSIFLLSLVSGVFPGLEEAVRDAERRGSLLNYAMVAIVTFLLSATVGKANLFPTKKEKSEEAELNYPFWIPAVFLFVLQICTVAFFLHLSLMDFEGYMAVFGRADVQLRLGVMILSLLSGILAGGLLGANGGFRTWVEKRNKVLGEFIPSIGSSAVLFSERITNAPHFVVGWSLGHLALHGSRASSALERIDYFLFAKRLQDYIANYTLALSRVVRRSHVGNVRIYFFVGVIVALVGSIIFMIGGK